MRRWADSGRIATITDPAGRKSIEGALLARFAEEVAACAERPESLPVVLESAGNRFVGLVTQVVRDTVMRHMALAFTVVAAAGLLLAGCGSSSTTAGSTRSSATESSSAAMSGTVNVFAAASLKEPFTELGKQFETAHPGVKVVFNFGPSSGLATQINHGAPADVFASASPKNMGLVAAAGRAGSPTNFASNVMGIAVPPRNPASIKKLSDLAKSGVKVALCQAAVPCGTTAAKVLTNARLTVTPVSQEIDVKAVLAKVTLGEVDAGVVYVTDVRAAGAKVKSIEIPADVNASTMYPIATLTKAPNKAAAQGFTDYVLSADGVSLLTVDGFAKP